MDLRTSKELASNFHWKNMTRYRLGKFHNLEILFLKISQLLCTYNLFSHQLCWNKSSDDNKQPHL